MWTRPLGVDQVDTSWASRSLTMHYGHVGPSATLVLHYGRVGPSDA
jgi:hypothetical protein